MTGKIIKITQDARRKYAERIATAWRGSVIAIIETGRLLTEAKSKLEHGEFESMVESDLPFNPSTAQRLMKIARDERISNPAHVQLLPPSWGTLYELTKLSDVQFERAISDGTICSDMQRGEIAVIRGTQGTGENEWYTPEEYIVLARSVLGSIDLDPASSAIAQKVVGAKKFYTKEDNGLVNEWHGRVWLNPPYAQPFIAEFMSKMVAEVRVGRVDSAIVLTHNYTDTAWFHEGATLADAICFTRGRIKFVDVNGEVAAPTQGQAFFYFGERVKLFVEKFSSIGFVVVGNPWR